MNILYKKKTLLMACTAALTMSSCNDFLAITPLNSIVVENYWEKKSEAEARCIRAFCYFQLVRTFQKVPLVLNASIGDDEDFKVAAASEDSIMAQIIDDLQWAGQYIWSASYFDDIAQRKGRFNKQSAKALLGDVYLWKGDYQRCAGLCKEIMDEKVVEYQSQLSDMQSGNYNSYMQNGDIMLMRAEALAYLGGETNCQEAFSLVEAVNERACGGQTKLTFDQTTIKEQILEERQRELMFEGKRWYDLVRMVRHSDNPTQAMRTLRNTYLLRKYDTGGQDAIARMASINNLYLPFYQSEVDVNPLLETDQNPAYKD
jgi:hypothetical protein